jgi:RNA polymerase-interacting CarD/CdnL/TRCF family regulator
VPFSSRSFKLFKQYTEQFASERGGGRVDVVLHGTGLVEGVVQTTVLTEAHSENQIVVIDFEDGHSRFVPMENIAQVIVREDRAKSAVDFTVGEALSEDRGSN